MKRSILLAATTLVAAMLPSVSAYAAPGIQLLNPSPYTQQGIVTMSDKPDTGAHYHLVAWVKEVPPNPIVEFELKAPGNLGLNSITKTATRVGNDAWEHFFEIPDDLPDSDGYTLDAILYSGNDQVAIDTQTVRINKSSVPPPDADNTVEITEPLNGGQAGFYGTPGSPPNTVIDVAISEGTRAARGFYSVTAVGNEVAWKPCGSGRPTTAQPLRAKIRCVLASGDRPSAVTAIAAVANNTPAPGPPNALADASGDSHRVFPYDQIPTLVDISPDSRRVEPDDCVDLVATITDQLGDEIAGLNVDAHATGPGDELQFGAQFDELAMQTNDDFQNPDKGVHASEAAIDCSNDEGLGEQGDHNRPNASDTKHVESVTEEDGAGNTSNSGQWDFVLHSDNKGGTQITVWGDVNDDDLQGPTEAAGGAALGWGEDPPPPERQVFIEPQTSQAGTGDCQRLVLSAKQGGSPLTGTNVDVHAVGPDDQVQFCDPGGGTPSRQPDAGGHVSGRDANGGAHIEGETDGNGQFIFGVVSNIQGATDIGGWIDGDDNDEFGSAEPVARAQVAWGGQQRSVATNLTLRYRRRAFRGTVKSSEGGCKSGRQVTIKRQKRGRDPVWGSDTSDQNGKYSVRARGKGRFYAVVGKKEFAADNGDAITCQSDRSKTIRLR